MHFDRIDWLEMDKDTAVRVTHQDRLRMGIKYFNYLRLDCKIEMIAPHQ